jgi:hypothetical protein
MEQFTFKTPSDGGDTQSGMKAERNTAAATFSGNSSAASATLRTP